MAPRLISLILLGFALIITDVDSSRTIPGDSFSNQVVVNEQKLEHASIPRESPAQHQAEQMVLQGGATVAAAPAGVALDDKKNFIAWGGVGGFSGIGGYAGLGGAFPVLGGIGGIGKFGGIGGAAGIGGAGGVVPIGGVGGLGGGVGGLGGGAGGLGGVGGIGGGTGGLGGGTGGLGGGAGGLGGAAGGVGGHAVPGGSLHPRP